MTPMFQCRKFQFFDLEKVDLDISIKEHLKDSLVRCGSSGRGRVLVGDSEGAVHSISRQFETRAVAQAHNKGIIQIHQLKENPFVVTLGEDEVGVHSIKIWDESALEQDSSKGIHLKKVIRFSRPQPPTCFAVHESLTLLAVGFEDGEIQLYRGELTRERNIRARILLHEGEHGGITGLAFKTMPSVKGNIILYCSSKYAMFPFDVTTKDKEVKFTGDKGGCELRCSCYSEGSPEDVFIVGRNDAVYCYAPEDRGPCFGFDGEKHLLYGFRGYVLIVALLSRDTYNLTIFDVANKFVAFASSLRSPEPIEVAACEWGSLFLLTKDGTFWQLKEKDLQTKMSVFFKKNYYDLAVRVAKNNNFDAEGMADIFRQYGDHLYNKGDLDGAIRQYCKTVGKVVPSYVVRKYLDSSRVKNLLEYLEVIHKTGHATPDLTTLLLNCLTKLKENEKIEHYVKDPSCDFLEPETAIHVFRKGGMHKHAYQLATKHGLYGNALQILLEDVRDPNKEDLFDILEKVVQDEKAEEIIRRFGTNLVQLVQQSDPKSVESLKRIVTLLCRSPVKRELVDLFIPNKHILVPLLEDICQEFTAEDGPLMNLLLEAYLDQWTKSDEFMIREKILALLSKAPDCPSWDWPRALLVCKLTQFSDGEIVAYEKLGLQTDLLEMKYRAALTSPLLWPAFMESCRKYAKIKPGMWKEAFFILTNPENSELVPSEVIQEVLTQITQEGLMEPLPILERLCATRMKLGVARQFLMKILDRNDIIKDMADSEKLIEETKDVRKHIEEIRTKPLTFQSSRCNACAQPLDLPSVHFLCLHSFHQHCFDSYASNDKDCPVCYERQKDVLGPESKERRQSKAALDADFALKLGTARSNSFNVLAEFFSKGIFKDENKQRGPPEPKKPVQKLRVPTEQAFNDISVQSKVTEGRLRLHEGSMRSYNVPIPESSVPKESYMDSLRQRPAPQLSSSLGSSSFEARRASPTTQPKLGTNLPFPRVQTSPAPARKAEPTPTFQPAVRKPPISISAAAAQSERKKVPEPKNPFEEEEEDEDTNNPFLEPEEKSATSKNPFEDDDDYDSSLNPFAE